MTGHNIQVVDLNRFSYDIHSEFGKRENDVHYTVEGYKELADVIVSAITSDN